MVSRCSLILLLAFTLIGCRPVQAPPTAGPVTEATATLPPPTPAPDYAALIRNAQYQLGIPDSLQIVQLQDGKYEQGAPGGTEYISVTLTDFVSAGDLDEDGVDEIVALIAENFGGTGVFVFLTVYKMQNGTPTFFTSSIIDDRPQLDQLSIEDGRIFLDAVIHAMDDPMCCPTLKISRHYRLFIDQLDLVDSVTYTPDGRARTITIESPTDGLQVYSTVQVKGSVAIAPFENNLTYVIKDSVGVELSRGAVPVNASELGGPGTFDTQISIGNIISGTVVFLEIQDVSAADGSVLSMDSVFLVVK